MRTILLLSTLALAACTNRIAPDPTAGSTGSHATSGATGSTGDTMANDQGLTSGSRLRARYYNGADGSKEAVGWYDSMRKENCSFEIAADGVIRCLPRAYLNAGSYFGDPACTVLVGFGPCSTTGSYISETAGNVCGSKTRIYSIGQPITGPVYASSGTSCVATTLPPGYTVVAVGPEVTADQFEAATEVVE